MFRTSKNPAEELPERGLLNDDQVLFHYTSKQANGHQRGNCFFSLYSSYFGFVSVPVSLRRFEFVMLGVFAFVSL